MDNKLAGLIYQMAMTTGVRMISCILNEMTVQPADKEALKRFKCMLGLIVCTDYANRNPDFREEVYEKHILPMMGMITKRTSESTIEDIKDILSDILKTSTTKTNPQPDAGPRPDLN